MPRDDLKTIGFAAVICVVCSLLLSTTASTLRERQAMNVELDRKINVLKAFGVPVEDKEGKTIAADEVERYFSDHISEILLEKATGNVLEGKTSADIPKDERKAKKVADKTILPLYVWKDDGKTTKYAFPVSGQGLWSTIYGYCALDSSAKEVVGVTFYDHAETPGLGGECSAEWFQSQFSGKIIWADGTLYPITVVKGDAGDNPHAVDGITGATMTGNGIQIFLRNDLEAYDKYFSKVRGG